MSDYLCSCCSKGQAEARNAQEPSSSAAEDEYEEEKDESENEYFYSEDDEDMPDTTPKKATSRPHSAKKAAAKVEDVTDQLEALALGKTKLFSTEFKLPYMIFMYPDNDDVMVKVEFFGPMLPEFSFKPDVINGGAALELKVECPEIFCNNTRSLIVNGDADGFNNNTSEAQAFKNTCDAIDEAYGFPDQLFGDPQVVQLPFSVEERIVSWSCNAFPNEMGELTDNLGGLQFHNIVTVTLRKLKVKKRTQGAFRVFAANGNNNGNA